MGTLGVLLALGFLAWFWQDSLRAKESAHSACRTACRRAGVQLLDDTVALERIWLRRSVGRPAPHWQLQIERRYTFEFTETGVSRSGGLIVMLGHRVEVLAMDGDDLLIP